MSKTEKVKYYAVRRGREPGIYESWEACRKQVLGFSGAVYKSFAKKEEAEAFLLNEEGKDQTAAPAGKEAQAAAEEPAYPEIYVDGSYLKETGEFSYGMVVLTGGEELCFCEKFSDPELSAMRNVAGEIYGAQAAMAWAMKEGVPGIYLYHDYAGIAHWCTGEWKANKPGTIAYRAYFESVRGRLDVRFVKVKGHSHDHYNDMADRLAKEALGLI